MHVNFAQKDYLRDRYIKLNFNAYELMKEISSDSLSCKNSELDTLGSRRDVAALVLKGNKKDAWAVGVFAALFTAGLGLFFSWVDTSYAGLCFLFTIVELYGSQKDYAENVKEAEFYINKRISEIEKYEDAQKCFVDKLIEMRLGGIDLVEYSFHRAEMGGNRL